MVVSTNAYGTSAVSSIPLINLQAGTSYVVQIQAVGNDHPGDVSNWSVGYVFVVPNL
jgi:predicted RNA-binding protein with TRAM domain